ncbi:MAG: acetylglutamate kinase [Acidobacteria bacterium RIFCSPLOWO2_02_FULL_65_29]|nr:MAG: acetylglutamate kinase [Acidobacteria bacterium RIFCSPLOWO2_02_FULL_65_29]
MSAPVPIVVKLGGELVENPERLNTVVVAMARVAKQGQALVIVHGAGKEIDAALSAAGIDRRQVDGLRITDDRTLDVVVAVLGAVNTRLVAALAAEGLAAVGLTGADGRCGPAEQAPPHRTVDGRLVDLGRVGIPSEQGEPRLVSVLVENAFVPVIACIGIGSDGGLFNVNADTFAAHLSARIKARRLVIAGTTPGVLDEAGATISTIDAPAVARLIQAGTATSGMIAKLRACEAALARGAGDVVIVDGRDGRALEGAALGAIPETATRMVAFEQIRT